MIKVTRGNNERRPPFGDKGGIKEGILTGGARPLLSAQQDYLEGGKFG